MAAAPTEGLAADTLIKFKLLQQRFVLGLPARWHDLSAASTLACRQDALHRLAGSAGSYGFERMSQLAREAEKLALAAPPVDMDMALAPLKAEIDAALAGAQSGP